MRFSRARCSRWRVVGGKRHGLGVAENLDGLLRGVYDDAAVLALGEMLFDFGAKRRVEHLVEIIRELGQQVLCTSRISSSPKVSIQLLTQFQPGPQQPRFYRGNRKPQRLRRLFRRQFFDVAQLENDSERGVEFPDHRRQNSATVRSARSALPGEGPQSSTSRGIISSPVSISSSSDTWLGRRLRSFISA